MFWSAHISWLFNEHPYLSRVAAARRAGFEWIETAWPEDDEPGRLSEAVAQERMKVALLNCPAGNTRAGERGFINDPSRRTEAEQAFMAAADLAEKVGSTKLNLLVGRSLPQRISSQRTAVIEALRAIGTYAGSRGLRVLIEPINHIENPGYLAPSPSEAVALIEQCGSDAVGLLLDVYHLGWTRTDPLAVIDDYFEMIGHVQISDWPGRGPPGTGQLNIRGVLERLRERGYAGAIGLEYAPTGSTHDSLKFLSTEFGEAALVSRLHTDRPV